MIKLRSIVILVIFIILIYLTFGIKSEEKKELIGSVEVMSTGSWGLSFQEEGKAPVCDVNVEDLKEAESYYLGDTAKKKIYLTFDAGFENGNTPKILDTLKEENIKACFFLVGNYMETCPDLVKRMADEGHIVANHTYHHYDMEKVMSEVEFIAELEKLESTYMEITGKQLGKFYRPPQGKYSMDQLLWAKDYGYKTIFWSLAYVDWDVNNQPTREEAIQKLTSRIHPGAIVLLHTTSDTNGEILGDIIKKWKDMGYSFGSLEEL